MLTLLFILFAGSFYISFHFYYAFFKDSHAVVVIPLLTLFILFLNVLFIFARILPFFDYALFKWVSYLSLVFCFYFVVFYLTTQILGIFFHIPQKTGVIIISLLACMVMGLGYINTRFIRTNHYTIVSDKVNQDVTMALVSDFHIGALDFTQSKMKQMVHKINSYNPDFVLIPGDIIDTAEVDIEALGYPPLFAELKPKLGTLISLGNHEFYFGDIKEVNKRFRDLSHTELLTNENKYYPSLNINFIGLNDKGLSKEREVELTDDLLKPEAFTVLLEHNPTFFSKNIAKYPIDLQVSGHTHAGQLFLGYIIELFLYEKPWGLLKKGTSHLITTAGVGTWGPPMRDSSYPEIIIIEIKKP